MCILWLMKLSAARCTMALGSLTLASLAAGATPSVHPGEWPRPAPALAVDPRLEARIAALTQQIAALGAPVGTALMRDAPDFHTMQEHLRTLPRPAHDTVGAQPQQR